MATIGPSPFFERSLAFNCLVVKDDARCQYRAEQFARTLCRASHTHTQTHTHTHRHTQTHTDTHTHTHTHTQTHTDTHRHTQTHTHTHTDTAPHTPFVLMNQLYNEFRSWAPNSVKQNLYEMASLCDSRCFAENMQYCIFIVMICMDPWDEGDGGVSMQWEIRQTF